jgi:hypothetical protein
MTITTAKRKAIRMPGKECPAASQLGIQWPPTTKSHHRNLGRNKKPSDSLPFGHAAEGSRSPIPSEPTPCPRPWITPQGATPAERLSTYHAISAVEHLYIADTNFTLLRHTEAR